MKKFKIRLDENNIVFSITSTIEVLDVAADVAPEMVGVDDDNILYDEENNTHNNEPILGYFYDENLNAFIPPKPDDTYILNTQTYEWEPDPNLTYDLHNDGIMYKYFPDQKCWMNA